jgi:hypothetical protein
MTPSGTHLRKMKHQTDRAKSNSLEKREKAVWDEAGWITDRAWPEPRFVPAIKRLVAARRDFFNRYDILAAKPEIGIMVGIQVSREAGTTGHEEPLGFNGTAFIEDLEKESVDLLCQSSEDFWQGFYEVYVYYRKLKGSRSLVPDRRWWMKPKAEAIPVVPVSE